MSEKTPIVCPECNETVAVDRRNFMKTVGGGAVALAAGGILPTVPATARAQTATPTGGAGQMRPAEALVRELWGTLTQAQRGQVVKPWDHRSANMLTRHRMVNAPIDRRIGEVYTAGQQELLQRILRAMCSDDTGYDRICRRENATRAFDGSNSFAGCGVDIFGEVADNRQWAWVFSGHHLTVRCDGDSEPDYAFGGPIYYGHTPDGYSQRNCFFHQTRAVQSVFEALTPQQRNMAVVVGTPGEHEPSVRFRPPNQPKPGLPAAEMSRGQKLLVMSVMREVISPFRTEDANEVMEVCRRNGGLDRIHLAFYRENNNVAADRWHFWRLEGPGFVWNYRVLPHVHTYVNVAVRQA